MKSFFLKFLAGAILFSILFVWIGSSLAYSDGYRSGRVIKVSKRGAVFKTIEGQLNNDSFGAIKGQNQFNQIFLFSVEKGNESLLEELREASLSGERVNIYYHERYFQFFWKGDTKNFVYRVDRISEEN